MVQPGGFWILFDTKKYQGEFPFKDTKPSTSNNIVVAKNKTERAGHLEFVSCNCKSLIINDRKCIFKKVRKSLKITHTISRRRKPNSASSNSVSRWIDLEPVGQINLYSSV